jgi:hypothetical protein
MPKKLLPGSSKEGTIATKTRPSDRIKHTLRRDRTRDRQARESAKARLTPGTLSRYWVRRSHIQTPRAGLRKRGAMIS